MDRLLLVEDAVRDLGEALVPIPATLFWSTVALDDLVDRDGDGFFLFPLLEAVVLVDCKTLPPSFWVEGLHFFESRHEINSVMRMEMRTIITSMT